MLQPETLVARCRKVAEELCLQAKASLVYRASIAYLLQNVRAFADAIKEIEDRNVTASEKLVLELFEGRVNHFCTHIVKLVSDESLTSVLNWSSVYVHKYIDRLRKDIIEGCSTLSLDPATIVVYDKMQDAVNKSADLQHLTTVLRHISEDNISIQNAVDVQQLIETRLRSLQSHLSKKRVGNATQAPSQDSVPLRDMQQKMEAGLSVFKAIDIPSEDLLMQDALGSGGFGTVHMMTRLSTAELLAVKEVRKDRLTMQAWASLYAEVATMRDLKHNNVLELVGAHVKDPYRIITRFCPGKSVFDRLHKFRAKPMTARMLTLIAYQVAEGMVFLHANGIVHRDLKTMNVLLDENNVAKIADFGLAGDMKTGTELMGGVGTPHYTAPEILTRKRYGAKVDTYSFGVILWEMAVRQIPFKEKTHRDIYDHVIKKNGRLPPSPEIPEAMWTLITRCWHQDPNVRPTFAEIATEFRSGNVYFKDGKLDAADFVDKKQRCPALNVEYLLKVLGNPQDENFAMVADFFASHVDEKMRSMMRKKGIMNSYTAQTGNGWSVLLLASELLELSEFPPFIDTIGNSIIKEIMAKKDTYQVRCAVAFCLKVPDQYFDLVVKYVPDFVGLIGLRGVGQIVIQLVARLPEDQIRLHKTKLTSYFADGGLKVIKDQLALDAAGLIFPMLVETMQGGALDPYIELIELPLQVPIRVIEILVGRVGKKQLVRLILALIKAAFRTDVTECLKICLSRCTPGQLVAFSKEASVLPDIQSLLAEGKSVIAALMLLYRLSMLPDIPPILAVEGDLLRTLLIVPGHTARKLQILTSLCISEAFCQDTNIAGNLWTLLASTVENERLSEYALKCIGALSSHATGCNIIMNLEMMPLFVQIFLSARCIDLSVALTILCNVSAACVEIPQLSLILSCLMQELSLPGANKVNILQTLIELVSCGAGASIQEYALHSSVIPLIAHTHEPFLVLLAVQLIDKCIMAGMSLPYNLVGQAVFNVLSERSCLHADVLVACVSLILSMINANASGMQEFVDDTHLQVFLTEMLPKIEPFADCHSELTNLLSSLSSSVRTNESESGAVKPDRDSGEHECDAGSEQSH